MRGRIRQPDDHQVPRNATIRIKRQDAYWRDVRRAYDVLVDGEEVGQIGNGETLDVAITPGKHCLKLKIDWTGSRELTFGVHHGEIRVFSSTPLKGLVMIGLIRSIFQRDRWITLTDEGSLER